jgi:phenylalanyl-tRNA synthetase beta chain
MKFSENWLREYVDPNIDNVTLCNQLTMLGLEVESSCALPKLDDKIITAQVIDVHKHQNADKLNLCLVDNGSEKLQIVCGALNVKENIKIVLAQVGAVLPGDFKIKVAKLRGVSSCGMICSASELALAKKSSGIMVLPDNAPVGIKINDYLKLNDHIIDLDITPNRADCFSILGIAREVAAKNNIKMLDYKQEQNCINSDAAYEFNNNEPIACPTYALQVIKNINPNATTPITWQEKLRRSDINSINPIVDLTNLSLMELGQPMHAFDMNKVKGKIQIRYAKNKEKIILLDEKEYILDDKTLVIADEEGAIAIAGIMGGYRTAVDKNTRDILLECANFAPFALAGVAQRYKLSTDASIRYERGVDTQLIQNSLNFINRHISLLYPDSQIGPINKSEAIHKDIKIKLNIKEIKRKLGIKLTSKKICYILDSIGIKNQINKNNIKAIVPSYRYDLTQECDLVEEVARVYGYDNIKRKSPKAKLIAKSNKKNILLNLKNTLVYSGYNEVISYSFVDEYLCNLLHPNLEKMSLLNPISEELKVMRPSLLPGLLKTLKYNNKQQNFSLKIFETGKVFLKKSKTITQKPCIGVLISGRIGEEGWYEKARDFDFFDIKSIMQKLLLHIPSVELQPSKDDFLHPNIGSDIVINDEKKGFVGQLHPKITDRLQIEQDVFVGQCEVDVFANKNIKKYQDFSRYPVVKRDLSVIVDVDVNSSDVIKIMLASKHKYIQDILLFDVYMDKKMGNNKKSLTFSICMQDKNKTLTDKDANGDMEKVVEALSVKLNAQYR